jgi:hypothetical protein
MPNLQKVSTNFFQSNRAEQWREPFSQATFFNYDVNSAIHIQKWVLQPAIVIGGLAYPTFLEISLNAGEINDSMYVIDTLNSTTANWQVIYTQYLGVQ